MTEGEKRKPYEPRGVAPPLKPHVKASNTQPPSRKGKGGGNPAMHCPQCGSQTRIATCRRIHNTYREVTYQCLDTECGLSFIAAVEVIRLVTPRWEGGLKFRLSAKVRDTPTEVTCERVEEVHQTGPPLDDSENSSLPF